MYFSELPYYLSVHLTVEECPESSEGTVKVEVHSKIHVNKVHRFPMSWSQGYVRKYPDRFRMEVLAYIIELYGLKAEPIRYS